jgi:hypothetical protein
LTSEVISTPEQSALYEEGGWSSFRLEETILEDLDRQHITEPVVVTLDNGSILFAVAKGEIQ